MATSVAPAPVAEGAVDTGAGTVVPPIPAPAGTVVPPTAPQGIAAAAARAREIIAAATPAAEVVPPIEGEAPPVESVPADETPEEITAREAEQLAATESLRVKIPGARGADGNDEDIEIEVSDEQTANAMRTLVRGYTRGEDARAIREQAQQIRDQADEIQYVVEIDPAGFLTNVVKKPQDIDHLFRVLATRPGVLDRHAQWVGGLLDNPDAVGAEAAVADAEGITRRDKVAAEVQDKRELAENARQLLRTTDKTIETSVPKGWSEEAREQMKQDVLSDLRVFANAKNLRTVDPRVIPGLVQRRIKLMGIQADPAAIAAPAAPGTAAPGTPGAPKIVTADDLKRQRLARRAAASAPPGAGSPVPTPPASPAFDPKQPGSPIQQAAKAARAWVNSLGKRPS